MIDSRPGDMVALCSVSGLLMTKTISLRRKTGEIVKSGYGNEKHFSVRTVRLNSFAEMVSALRWLCARSRTFVIRGAPLPTANLRKCRRLVHDDPETGDVATFAEAPRHWFAVDIDKVAQPAAIDPIADPDGAIEWLIGLLPPELQDASCWWQFTTSQGLPGYEGTLSSRLWFWGSEPVDDASLTRWALAANRTAGSKIVDLTLYRAVQPHYIAPPIFDGMRDPVPRRCGVRHGLDEAVSLVIPEPDPDDHEIYGAHGFVGVGVDGFLQQIGGERGFRSPMVAAIASYFATNGPDADPDPIKASVRGAITAAPSGGRSDAEIKRYLSDRHLGEIIGWVRQHERANPRPNSEPRAATLESLRKLVTEGVCEKSRNAAIARLAGHLLCPGPKDPYVVLELIRLLNDARCRPPLTDAEIVRTISWIAAREISRRGASHG
jgi:hypothetical protein